MLRKNVSVSNSFDYAIAGPAGSRKAVTTFCLKENLVFCGCFSGDLESFSAKVEKTHADNAKYLAQYRSMIAYFTALRNIYR